MDTVDKIGISLVGGLVVVFGTAITLTSLSSDETSFDRHPDKPNCLIVNYKTDTLTGPEVDKSGVYCKE